VPSTLAARQASIPEEGFEFRATKDLDIVLNIDALSPAFGAILDRIAKAYDLPRS